ncbi:MAG TPA: NAD(P)-binding protein [Gaiellales bacterium]|nr:NAD(P)-binding protein [Gaiellales bacterium]
MARVVIVGGGIGGLCTALLLGREGHEVTVCECDPAPVPASPDEAWSRWPRPGTPQARLGHSFLAGFRSQMRERLPDVLELVLGNGAPQSDVAKNMPGEDRRAEDAELGLVLVRRPVLEAALRRAVEAEPTVRMLAGRRVRGLLAEPVSRSGVPRVSGVDTAAGSIQADTVVVAGGRAVPVGRWFGAIGADAPSEQAEGCGSACYTRYFRILDRDDEDDYVASAIGIHREPGYLLYELQGADNRTFAAEIAVPITDKPMKRLRDTAVWTAAAMSMPEWPEWIDPERSQPITPAVDVMGQERNTLRRFVADGRPLALGVHVIGDARCQTDSLFAWGCGNALMAAAALADAIADHPGDDDAQALALADAVDGELADRYAYSVARDRASERLRRGEPRWDTMTAGIGLIDGVLWPAADHDADVFRAVHRWDLQLDPAGQVESDTTIVERARAALGEIREPPVDNEGIPTREQLLDAMASAGAPASGASGAEHH